MPDLHERLTARKRVHDGARLLDADLPGVYWWRLLTPEKINIAGFENCILGQLSSTGYDVSGMVELYAYGFLGFDAEYCRILDQEWRCLVEQRRARDD